MTDSRDCVQVKGHGYTEQVPFEIFAWNHIQDEEAAVNIARLMLDGQDPYPLNEDEPEFFVEFSIYDREEFIRQLQAVERS